MVLILVLMEDTLRANREMTVRRVLSCLNPCFNGRYSQSKLQDMIKLCVFGLNPCFNGRYSQRVTKGFDVDMNAVLILVLMEDTLRV